MHLAEVLEFSRLFCTEILEGLIQLIHAYCCPWWLKANRGTLRSVPRGARKTFVGCDAGLRSPHDRQGAQKWRLL